MAEDQSASRSEPSLQKLADMLERVIHDHWKNRKEPRGPVEISETMAWRIIRGIRESAPKTPLSERGPSRAEHDIEQAFQVLEAYGVPRERARSIQNGIGVLATRIEREEHFQKALEADAARYRWLRGGVHLNRFALDRQIQSEAEMDAAIDAELAKSNERPDGGGNG